MHGFKPVGSAVTGSGVALALALASACALAVAGCGSASNDGGPPSRGSGGASAASGGANASSGGSNGSGGAPASTGGATGSGGSASGGASSGGATASGGSGSGGAASGGAGTAATGGGAATGGHGAATGGSHGGASGATAGGSGGNSGAAGSSGGTFILTSPDQMDGAKFATKFTCAAANGMFGSGVNPELDWSGVPDKTLSFAITFIDTKLGESSPLGQHWAAWDIPARVMKFPQATTTLTGDLMGAKQTNKYLAPCPSGNDTYEFTVYALPTATLAVTGAEGTGVSNSAGVAKVLAALKTAMPLGTAKLHGTSGPMGK